MDTASFQLLLDEWRDAPRGHKTAVIERAAQQFGVSAATLYRRLNAAGHRGPGRDRTPDHPEYREWAGVLAIMMAKAPKGAIPLDLCVEVATTKDPVTGEQMLPTQAAKVPLGTYRRILREGGFRQEKKRTRKLHADHPNQAWQFDASTSEYLTVGAPTEDGDRILKLYHRPDRAGKGYKNKPLGPDRLRLVYYGVWDMCTGYRYARAVSALGESGLDAMEFLCGAFERRDDLRDPMHGLPIDLWVDQGPLTKYAATRDLLRRLAINTIEGKPYQHTRQGGIESGWRTIWRRFELSLFLLGRQGEPYTTTVSALNARLAEFFCGDWNTRPCRNDPTISRRDAWVRGMNLVGGARLCPQHPLETLATEVRRTLDSSGCFQWENITYEVERWHGIQVIARRALDDSGRVIVEHPDTGERLQAATHQPIPYSEFRGKQPQLPIERAATAGAKIKTGVDPFAPAANAATNVVSLPPRAKPAAELPDPLEAGAYASLDAAMTAFHQCYPYPLSIDNRRLIEARVQDAGLRKDAVRELALTLTHIGTR